MGKTKKIVIIPGEELDMFTKHGVKSINKGNIKIRLQKICGKPNCLNPDNCTYPKCQN